jgi:outer membrane lipoprotein SlyB
MNLQRVLKPARLAAFSALTAAFAASVLTACGPGDSADRQAAVRSVPAAPGPATVGGPSDAPPPAPAIERQGTPVPLANDAGPAVPPAVAPSPIAPVPAQSATPVAPQPTGYAAPPAHVAEPPAAAPRPVDRNRVGTVRGIEPIRERPPGTGVGAVVGGVLGAVVGNQFGHGTGRAAMTGVGAVGGAVAGNNVERNQRKAIVGYQVAIRLDNGTVRSFRRNQVASLHVGDRVRLEGGSFRRL